MVRGAVLIYVLYKPLLFSVMSVILFYLSLPVLSGYDTSIIQQNKCTLYYVEKIFSVGVTCWNSVNNHQFLENSDTSFLLHGSLSSLILFLFRNHNSVPICMSSSWLHFFVLLLSKGGVGHNLGCLENGKINQKVCKISKSSTF